MRLLLSLVILLAACGDAPRHHKRRGPVALAVNECEPAVGASSPLGGTELHASDPHTNQFGSDPTPFHVHLGWPSTDPATSISFVWRTDPNTLASVVEYGVDGKLTERAEGASFLYGGVSAGSGSYRVHELKLCSGLEPGTTYTYRVGGRGHWSPEHTFTTPQAPGTFDTFRVAVTGDSRGAYETWADVLALMDSYDPDFFLFSGDMVQLGPNQWEWDAWFDATGDILARKVLVPAHGNHEFLAVHYFAQFSLPNNEQWFSIRYGDMHLVSLNDTVRDFAHTAIDEVDYMDHVFTETESRWQVAMHHQAIYSRCTVHRSNLALRSEWEPVYDRHGVDLVLTGHNHIYERSVPIPGGVAQPDGDGAVHVVAGGAGAPLYTGVEEQWFGAVANPVEHFVILEFGPTGIEGVVRDLSENVIDQFTIPR